MISKEKIEEIMTIEDSSAMRNALYIAIYNFIGKKDYHSIFGLKLYISSDESNRQKTIVKALDFMEKNGFEVHFYEYEKPKIIDDKIDTYVCNYIQPERLSEKTLNSRQDLKNDI